MKKVLIALQIALVGLFLLNTGIFKIFSLLSPPVEKVSLANEQKFREFMKEKADRAEKLGINYSPELYFQDLTEIAKMKIRLPNCHEDFFQGQRLFAMSCEKWRQGHYTSRQIEAARDKYKDFIDPGREGREQITTNLAQHTFWPKVKKSCLSLARWIALLYCKNLLLAFIWLLLWWYKEYQTFKVRNPLSFTISALFYPYVIGKIIYQWFKLGLFSFYTEVELRRTKDKFFTLLSRDEINEIRRFAKSGFGRKLFIHRLRLGRKEFQRSFGSAVVATLLLSFVSVIVANVQTQPLPKESHCQNSSLVVVHESPPQLIIHNDQLTGGNHYHESVEEAATVWLELLITTCQRLILEICSKYSRPIHKIEHVPVVG
jgi:hypothetical protein